MSAKIGKGKQSRKTEVGRPMQGAGSWERGAADIAVNLRSLKYFLQGRSVKAN